MIWYWFPDDDDDDDDDDDALWVKTCRNSQCDIIV
jgi:hypothetical protein